MKNLSDIPNEQGFRAALIRHDSSRLPVYVALVGDTYRAINIHTRLPVTDSEPWGNFAGWEELPQETPYEAHLKTAGIKAFPNMKRIWSCLKTKEQALSHDKQLPKKGEARIIARLGAVEYITLTSIKSTYGKPLYCIEQLVTA